MKQPTQTERIENLESAVDLEITGSLNSAMKRVISSHESALRNEVKVSALASVKVHIDALPDYAAEHVWDVLQRFTNGAFTAGASYESNRQFRGRDDEKAPDIKSVFG